MKIYVEPHIIKIEKQPVNEREANITFCQFEFSEEITSEFVKEAYFTLNGETYKQIIVNNMCAIPQEVLQEKGQVELGVVAYKVVYPIRSGDGILTRYNPSPVYFNTWLGSLKDNAENSEPITPSEMEQYEQALQDGLSEVNSKLEDIDQALTDVNTAITETNNLDLDVSKEGKVATVTLTKKDATTKVVTLSDGTNLMFNWDGTKLGIKTDEDEDYTYVDLQGVQGETGPMGAPFTIKKTYSSIAEMNADFDNMEIGDYVMIASTVEVEDNAKLYTKGAEQWIFITDFSGATGIQGPTGLTPNIQIGTVTSGATPSVTRTGTNENPILNFTLVKGDKGDTGATGATGATGNGIASITKTSTSGLVDTYTITFTDGTTTTFEVTNGEDGEVTQAQLDQTNLEVEKALMIYNAMPKVNGSGTDITLNNTAETPLKLDLKGNTYQYTTTGKQLFNVNGSLYSGSIDKVNNGFKLTNDATYRTLSIRLPNSIPAGTYKLTYDMLNSTLSAANMVSLSFRNSGGELGSGRTSSTGETTITISNAADRMYIYMLSSEASGTIVTLDNFMVSVEGGDFEPYTNGASPNPDYPQEVKVVTGRQEINVVGKNLLPKGTTVTRAGVTYTVNDDGSITLNGTATSGSYIDIYANQNTSIVTDITKTYTFTKGITNSDIGLDFFERVNGSWVSKLYTFSTSATYTPTGTQTGQQVRLFVRTGATVNNVTVYPMIVEGTNPGNYKPHQEQNYEINLGKNYFSKTLFDTAKWNVTGTEEEFTIQAINSGTTSQEIPYDFDSCAFSGTIEYTTLNGSIQLRDGTTNRKTLLSVFDNTSGTSTISETAGVVNNLRIVVYNNTSIIKFKKCQLENGTTITPYAPYFTPIELCKIGDYQDKIIGTVDNWKIHREIGKVVFNGSEIWQSRPNYSYCDRFVLDSVLSGNIKNLYCNYFKYANNINETTYPYILNNGGQVVINYSEKGTTTLEQFKTWLSTHNTIVYYILATPVEEQITNSTLISQLNEIYYKAKGYKDQTNISSNGNLAILMDAETVRDLSGIFEL